MPDGTTRLSKDGKEIFHFMGCSTFAEYAVISEISAAKIHPGADLYEVFNVLCIINLWRIPKLFIIKTKNIKILSYFSIDVSSWLWSFNRLGSSVEHS